MAQMVVFVLDCLDCFEEVLQAWEKAGAPGVTILDSMGVGRLKGAALRDDLPPVPSLRDLLSAGDLHHRTLFSVVDDDSVLERVIQATERVVGDFSSPHSGLLFVVPVSRVIGLKRTQPKGRPLTGRRTSGSSVRKPGFSIHLMALALYGILSLALTWPLVTHLATHVPGSAVWAYDEYTFVWNMWWVKFSALNLGQWPFHTDYIFYPLGIDLISYTLNLFNGLMGLPLQLVLPLPLASNLVILFACVMSGFGAYLLGTYLLRGAERAPGSVRGVRLAAFIAGAAYAFAASRMIYLALGHYNVVTAQWFPFYALFFLKTWREPGYRNPVLAGVFTTFILLAEPFFGVFWLFLTALLALFEWLDARRRRREGAGCPRWRPLIVRLAVMGAVAGLLWLPVLLPMLGAYRQGAFDLAGWGQGLNLSADLAGWFTPTALHPLLGAASWPAYLRAVVEGKTPFRDVNTVFLGYGILVLAIAGAVTAWKRARTWAWGAVVFGVLTLGPLLQIRGQYLFPLDGLLGERGRDLPPAVCPAALRTAAAGQPRAQPLQRHPGPVAGGARGLRRAGRTAQSRGGRAGAAGRGWCRAAGGRALRPGLGAPAADRCAGARSLPGHRRRSRRFRGAGSAAGLAAQLRHHRGGAHPGPVLPVRAQQAPAVRQHLPRARVQVRLLHADPARQGAGRRRDVRPARC